MRPGVGTGNVLVNGGTLTESVANALNGGAAQSLAVSSGSATLNQANNYGGGTTVSGGTLSVATISDSGPSSIGDSTAPTNNILTLGGGTLQYTGTGDSTTRNVVLTATSSVVVSGGASSNLTLGGTVSGTGFGLTLDAGSTGTLILTGSNTYSGPTTITAGTLQLGNGSTTGSLSTSSAISVNGTLAFDRSNTVAQGTDFSAGAISGNGGLIQLGSGTLLLTHANTYAGGTTIRAGTIEVANASGTPGTVTLGDANTGTGNVAWLFAGSLTPATNIVVANLGSGTVTLGTYSAGTFTASSGTLTLNRAVTLTDATGDRTTFNGQISGNVGTITITGTRVTFGNGSNNFVGNLVINSGSAYQNDNPTALPITTSVTDNGAFRINSGGTHTVQRAQRQRHGVHYCRRRSHTELGEQRRQRRFLGHHQQ